MSDDTQRIATLLYTERGSLYCQYWGAAKEFAPKVLRAIRLAAQGDQELENLAIEALRDR
jgi:hypothetical protein